MMIRDSAKQKALDEEYRVRDQLVTNLVSVTGDDTANPGTAGDYESVARTGGFSTVTLRSLAQQSYWPLEVSAQVAEALGHDSLEAAMGWTEPV